MTVLIRFNRFRITITQRADYEADAKQLKPQHVIVAGLVSAAVFVLALFALVKWITR